MAEKKADGGVRSPLLSRASAAFKRNQEYPILPPPSGAPPPRRPALSGGDFPVTKEGYTTPAPKNRSTGFL